jgi:hypothetical protein
MSSSPPRAGILSADFYDKPKAREYQRLMDVIHGRGEFGEDTYGHLMKQEGRVLDTVERVVNDSRMQEITRKTFLNLSLLQIAQNTARTLFDVYTDILLAVPNRDWERTIWALTRPDRRVYLGIVILIIAVLAMLIQISK